MPIDYSKIRNLAAAALVIKDLIKEDLENKFLSNTERNFLKEILADINVIEQHAVDSTNTFQKKPKGYTQPLSDKQRSELVTTYKTTLESLQKRVNALRTKIEEFLSYQNNHPLRPILTHLTGLEFKLNEMIALEKQQLLKAYQNAVLIYAALLGGSYLPLLQHLDPLAGKQSAAANFLDDDPGCCYGYVRNWAQQINANGRCTTLPKRNAETFQLQQDQDDKDVIGGWSISDESEQVILYNIINDICYKISSQYCYEIRISLKHVTLNHALGIRRIPNSETIEFIDANAILTVFPNETAFKLWFVMHINQNYPTTDKIFLITLDKQPENATASLQTKPLTNLFKFPFHKKYIIHLNNIFLAASNHQSHPGASQYTNVILLRTVLMMNVNKTKNTKQQPLAEGKIAVCNLIQQEIERLNKSLTNQELCKQKIAALNALGISILYAPEKMMLMTVIQIWKLTVDPNTQTNYEQLIFKRETSVKDAKQSESATTSTEKFINSLYELEICEPILKPSHENLLDAIKKLVTQNWTSKVGFFGWGGGVAVGGGWAAPHTIAAIRNVIYVKSNDDARTMLEKIKNICVKRQSPWKQ